MRRISRGARKSGGMKKKFLWKWNPKRGILLWDVLDINNFYFLFLLFSDFIEILFSFSFSFLLNDEEACDTAIT